jgi:hypothetical protein
MNIQAIQKAVNEVSIPELEDLDVMGYDDITGMTPNSNLALIASGLDNINETLKKIARLMEEGQ